MAINKALLNTPVLLMLFNRPDITRELFKKIREVRPTKLFVAANGPRRDVSTDIELCKTVRKIFDEIDWECELHTNFPETNVNMHIRWCSTLDWFFESVDSGIILEDDCIPDLSFFSYCTELLERYKDNPEIMHINGSNFQFGRKRGNASYYFSKYAHVWGWATWKRAWKKYDDKLSTLPMFEKKHLIDTAVTSGKEKKYWLKYFGSIYSGKRNSCDIKWLYATWLYDGLSITPNVNMISNIGYGLAAGHTFLKNKSMGQQTFDLGKIVHPTPLEFVRNLDADSFTFKSYFHRNFFQKAFYVTVMKIINLFR
jgi:hypothetical protein